MRFVWNLGLYMSFVFLGSYRHVKWRYTPKNIKLIQRPIFHTNPIENQFKKWHLLWRVLKDGNTKTYKVHKIWFLYDCYLQFGSGSNAFCIFMKILYEFCMKYELCMQFTLALNGVCMRFVWNFGLYMSFVFLGVETHRTPPPLDPVWSQLGKLQDVAAYHSSFFYTRKD